jgi:hypothetical protein
MASVLIGRDSLIVIFRSYGSHSNRLFQNLSLEAFCMEHDIEFANPTLADMSHYYVSPARSDRRAMSWFLRTSAVTLLRRAGLLAKVINFDTGVGDPDLLLTKERGRVLYVEGWAFRAYALTEKHQNLLTANYSLKEEYYSGNATLERIMSIDPDRHVTVAVHVRRGDYRAWKGGMYYFEDDTYRRYMAGAATAIKTRLGKGTVFVVFSDEATSFVDSAQVIVSNNPWYLDHHLMSRCDYIIGPPSTFSLWASYMGKTKYLHFVDASGEIDLDSFGYCVG